VERRAGSTAALILLCVGQAMVVLDLSIVNVALPTIRTDLGFSATGLQWVVNGYALTYTGFLLFGGRLADVVGRRRMFVAGLALFSAASLAGALAPSPGVLIAARAVQGVGGAILSPATLTLVTTTFTGAARGRAMAAWSAVAGAGAALGSALGGVLTQVNWRWIFWVNVPVGIIAIAASFFLLAETRSEQRTRLDLTGSALVTLALAAITYGTIDSTTDGWASVSTLAPLLGGLVLLGWFIVHEARVAAEPIMPLRFFSVRPVTVANVTMFLLGFAVVAHFYFLSLYMQNVLHYRPLVAGLAFVPGAAAMMIGAYSGPVLIKRVGIKPLILAGPVIVAGGLAWLSFVPVHGTYLGSLLVPMLLVTFGTGIGLLPLNISATSGIDPSEAGLASGMINVTRQGGGAIGLAVLATVAASNTHGTTAQALVSGYSVAFAVAAVAAVLAVAAGFAMPASASPLAPPAEQAAEPTSTADAGTATA
jgi:EmrB/QacA subfamily drug resistance transporter